MLAIGDPVECLCDGTFDVLDMARGGFVFVCVSKDEIGVVVLHYEVVARGNPLGHSIQVETIMDV